MSAKKPKIAIVTTSRADFGLLKWPLRALEESVNYETQLIVSGTHLLKTHGFTVSEIEQDGFKVDARVKLPMQSGQDTDIAQSMGDGISGFAEAFDKLSPDLIMVLGDRYEMFAAICAATVMRLPIAHLCGGDVTEGAYDDVFRHAMSKAAHIHFPTNQDAARRLEQMGELPHHIHMVGSTGLDALQAMTFWEKEDVFKHLEFVPRAQNLMVTHHPVTRQKGRAGQEIMAVLQGLEALGPNVGLIFTGVNADSESDVIAEKINAFCETRRNAKAYKSLGQALYLQTLNQVDGVVGNSSSGLYEAPSFGIPTINIGDRQKGRLKANSVLDVMAEASAITKAVNKALKADYSTTQNPYGDGHASAKIVSALASYEKGFAPLLSKSFHDIAF